MSDTPRTDAQWSGFHEFTKDFEGVATGVVTGEIETVDKEFARKLEREVAEKDAKLASQAEEIERLKEKVETLKVRLNAYYGECKPCSRCQGTGKDPEIKNCTCDCCEGTGWEVDA